MAPDELFQRAVVARRYYLEGRTRIEIAQEFGISRFKVARMLDDALASGMVEITIHNPGSVDVELSTALQRKYGLEHAYAVVTSSNSPLDRMDAVAKAMAELMQSILGEGDVIGVDCGRTLTHVPKYLTSLPRCDAVQLTGMAGALDANGADLVRRISEVTGGRPWPLYTPLVVGDARTAASLARDHQIQETVARHKSVTCAIVSVGAWGPGTSQVYDALPPTEAEEFGAAGVHAETCALLLDAAGQRVAGLDERRMGVDEATLRATPTVVAICTGLEKASATRSVLRSGLVSSLVTDSDIATAVLD